MHLYRLGELTWYSLTDIPLCVFLLTESTVVTIWITLFKRTLNPWFVALYPRNGGKYAMQ